MKHGSLRPDVAPRFKKVVPGQKIADTRQYKALEDLALAAYCSSQLKRKIRVEIGRKLMRELGSRNNEIANALKTSLRKSTLRFYDRVADAPSRESSVSPSQSCPRPAGTRSLESLLLHSPSNVKSFRKCLDRKSGKPIYRPAKFKIVRVTKNTYITDTKRVFRKNHIPLKRNFINREVLAKRSAAASTRGVTVGQTLPPRKIAPRGQITMPTQRCPISIVPAPYKRTLEPLVVLLSDSDTQEATIRTQSPRRSPGSMSTPNRAARGTSAPLLVPSAHTFLKCHQPHCTRLCLRIRLWEVSPCRAVRWPLCPLPTPQSHELRRSDLVTPFRWFQSPLRRPQLPIIQFRQESQNQILLLQEMRANLGHHSPRCRTMLSHKLLLLRVPGRQVETGKLQLVTEAQFATPSKKWKNPLPLLHCLVKWGGGGGTIPRSPRSVVLFEETPKILFKLARRQKNNLRKGLSTKNKVRVGLGNLTAKLFSNLTLS